MTSKEKDTLNRLMNSNMISSADRKVLKSIYKKLELHGTNLELAIAITSNKENKYD